MFSVNDSLYQKRPGLIPEHRLYEASIVEIDKNVFHKNGDIIIGVMYRPPDTDLKLFSDSY